jgi:hypothetical protein
MEKLYELLYTSELAIEESPSCVAGIVRVSRANNLLNAITGLLVFDGLHFCQYLEGSREAVLKLVDTIAKDTRHILFAVHEQGEKSCTRRFAEWSMAYALSQDEQMIPDLARPDSTSPILRLEKLLPSLSHST